MLNLNNALLIFILWFAFFQQIYSQPSNYLEKSALNFFCTNLVKLDEDFASARITFSGCTNGKASKPYDIIYCIVPEAIVNDSLINKVFLDSLTIELESRREEMKNIGFPCDNLEKRFGLFSSEQKYRLFLYNHILLYGKYYVEIFLLNEKYNKYSIICIEFNKNFEIISHYFQHMTYD